jgi:maleylacetoacetate isomerase
LNNLRVLNAVKSRTGEDGLPLDWIAQWIHSGFAALEALLQADTGRHSGVCFGEKPGLVECYLIPQIYAAKRFDIPLGTYPEIEKIDARCALIPAFERAHPDNQPDAPRS